ncbi:ATP phosphoribosyltransferase regulatory subunit [Halalkalibacillus sediminis]|uniref:ATP phosphoribosyltransferase regulatory subunit n=1 Tax=Halalkalibacillus sediminis TaxID=2018042 RepID=A0A2I0QRU1_9BACI|nr:ATP phosphoribosyltransferase regulatory subunit [Halalkalibacillus sediminis]PKR77041.1 ATP phosphoribosyltransferase regulatory subunit [Halalkalibacillus sediminis]
MKFQQQLPKGVADLYSQDYQLKQQVIEKLNQLNQQYGFKQIQTPTFEYYDLFVSMPGTMDTDQMIKMVDHDGKILVLRPDATIPITRMVASSDQAEHPESKLSYVTNIFRMENGESDVFSRSFAQVGVEHFGKASVEADVEMIALAIESFKKVGMNRFQLDIGQANYFKALIGEADLSTEKQLMVQEKIEQKNLPELKQLLEDLQLDEEITKVLLQLPQLFGTSEAVLKKADELAINQEMKEAVRYLTDVYSLLDQLGYGSFISIDLGLINHLNYYTGVVFQGFIHDFGKPVIQGGRYDDLTQYFGMNQDAIGFGVYVDDLIAALKSQGITEEQSSTKLQVHADEWVEGFKVARELRQRGFEVHITGENQSSEDVVSIDINKSTVQIPSSGEQVTYTDIEDLVKKVGSTYGSN